MRQLIAPLCLCAALLSAAACNPAADTGNSAAPAANSKTTTTSTTTTSAPPSTVPPISTAHGSSTPPAPVSNSGPAAAEQPEGVNTAPLDAKIEKLETKVKAGSAADADKKALAAVYLERANVYRDAGSPRLYKFALGDYRHVLRYDPANAEAKAKMDEIVAIYNSMGRPVPTNGLDQ